MIIDDDLVEDSETFFVMLTSLEPALVGSTLSRATITINPDPADGKDTSACIIHVAEESLHYKTDSSGMCSLESD